MQGSSGSGGGELEPRVAALTGQGRKLEQERAGAGGAGGAVFLPPRRGGRLLPLFRQVDPGERNARRGVKGR